MSRQNRNNNPNSNTHHNNNPSSVNYDVMSGPSILPPPLTGPLGDPNNFSMLPNLMDLFLRQNGQLSNPSTTNDPKNASTSETNPNASQSSPPVQRFVSQCKELFFNFIH